MLCITNCLIGIENPPWVSPNPMKINPEAPAPHTVVFSLVGALWVAEGCQGGRNNVRLDIEHLRFDSFTFFFISVKSES